MKNVEELWNIRLELLVRIGIQNLVLLMAVGAFVPLTTGAVGDSVNAWAFAAIYGVVSFALILQWCHSGVRTMQIKKFILIVENGSKDTWERWLPANRPRTFLGTRWLISTKGVFLGLQLVSGLVAALFASAFELFWVFGWVSAFIASTWFLLSNPKESLER